MAARLTKSRTAKHEVSERTLEVVVAMAITLLACSGAYFATKQIDSVFFVLLFTCATFLQGRLLNRNVLVHVPFLVVASLTSFWYGLILMCVGTLLTSLASQKGLRKLTAVFAGELAAVLVTGALISRLIPEMWLVAGVVFVLVRSGVSVLVASRTGLPLDFATISGGWALVAGMAYASTATAVHYFERAEISQIVVVCFGLLAIAYLGTTYGFQRAREDFQKGITGLSGLLNYSHTYTGSHSRRVAYLARETGRRLGIAEWKLDQVVQAALLHDIGKIAVDERILEKPGRLTDEEFAKIKEHPGIGEAIVASVSELTGISTWIRHHHERVDGRGYPDGLVGKQIPLESRLICVIDAYDAMTGSTSDGHRRLYRDPVSSQEAIEELVRCSGSQFDPTVVKKFKKVVAETQVKLL